MSRPQRVAYYGVPMLFCLLVHWRDLRMWFWNDDFTWLSLPGLVHSPGDLMHVLFSPMAEGTVRTLSERLFFLVFSSVFGLYAPPFRTWVFLTMFACIYLLMEIARRLTGSATAGFLAGILWPANAGLAIAIGWSSAYNEIAFAFFLLLAFRLFLLYVDTGRRKYWVWQWVVFILGFGALELNVMYPMLAAGYALCCARPYFKKTLWLFVPSIVFTAVHVFLIPSPTDPYYRPQIGAGVFATLWRYWTFALGAVRDSKIDWRPLWLGVACVLATTAALALFAARRLRQRDWLPVFLVGWFFVAILPVLPFRNHFTEYYVTAPVIGLAILAGWGLSQARSAILLASSAVAILYLSLSIQDDHIAERFYDDRSRQLKHLITALQSLPKTDTSKKIILAGVRNDLFWTGFIDDPFRFIGIREIYLFPGSERSIDPHPEFGGIARYVLSPEKTLNVLYRHEGAVFQLEGRRMIDVTGPNLAALSEYVATHFQYVDAGDPASASRLGPTWYPAEGAYRWMPKTATLKIGGPQKDGQALEITGHCPAVLLTKGPLEVTFSADGVEMGRVTIKEPNQHFDFELALPPALVGKPEIEIAIEVSHTTRIPGDLRDLGLIFGTFRIK